MVKQQYRKKSALTEQQEKFTDGLTTGLNIKDSLAVAGYSNASTGSELMSQEHIKKAISAKQRQNQLMLGMTRETVLEGMMEAITQAKLIADPMTQVAGWREIAKICGFYAPEVKKIELNATAKSYLQKMEQLSDEELLLISQSEIIEAEYEEVSRGA